MKYILDIALIAAASASTVKLAKTEKLEEGVAKKLIKVTANKRCEGTWCPGGCCNYDGWYCCPGDLYCAPTADDCPRLDTVVKKQALEKMGAKKQCMGLTCPGGCCPMDYWWCCPDDLHCAPTLDDCPSVAKKQALVKVAADKQCDFGKLCPNGCCPYEEFYCCSDPAFLCAATLEDCFLDKK